jgi:hypothetical protein
MKQKLAKQTRSPRFTHLDEERINLLTQIGFVWSSIDKKWFEMLEWAKVYGVVNYQLQQQSLSIGGDCDVLFLEEDDKSNDTTAMEQQQFNNSNFHLSRLIESYYKLVHNLQNQTLLSSFYPQKNILTMLLNVNSTNMTESNDTNNYHFQSLHLDYRIPPNDAYHQPLRIWMINQRSNYNRLSDHHLYTTTATNTTAIAKSLLSSTMTPQRQHALENIYFPWSGRYRNRIEEVQYEKERNERVRQIERKDKKERDERERIERLLLSPKLSSPLKLDVMDLWAAEEDDDDDDDE